MTAETVLEIAGRHFIAYTHNKTAHGQLLELMGNSPIDILCNINKLHAHLLKVAHFPEVRSTHARTLGLSLCLLSHVRLTAWRTRHSADRIAHLSLHEQEGQQRAPALHAGQGVARRAGTLRQRYAPHTPSWVPSGILVMMWLEPGLTHAHAAGVLQARFGVSWRTCSSAPTSP